MKIKIEVTFPAELKDEAILCNLCKNFNIILNIVEASFSTEVGWAILIIETDEPEMKNVFAYLENRGIIMENTQEITQEKAG